MKNRFAILIVSSMVLSLLSCNDYKKETSLSKKGERFSTTADTVYKTNSTKIDEIERTFYKKPQTRYDPYMEVSNIVGTDIYNITATEYENEELVAFTSIELTKKGAFEKVLNSIDTILKHPKKDLTYTVEDCGIISSSLGGVLFFNKGVQNNSIERATFGIENSAERDSLRNAYQKYKQELGK